MRKSFSHIEDTQEQSINNFKTLKKDLTNTKGKLSILLPLQKIKNKSNLKECSIQFLLNISHQKKNKTNKNHRYQKGNNHLLSKVSNNLQKKDNCCLKSQLRISSLEFQIWEDLVNNLNNLKNNSLLRMPLIN